MTWTEEVEAINKAAASFGVDARFIGCIRKQEHGREGREFGVLDGRANDYQSQLTECCRTVAHRLYLYDENDAPFVYDTRGLHYSPGFIVYFAGIWAPRGVSNDPTDLNANWLPGVTRLYAQATGPNGLFAFGV